MSHHRVKQFRNIATTPIEVSVAACVDDNGFVRDIHFVGGTVNGFTDDAQAEHGRISNWIRETFIGQTERFFAAHNGVVPHGKIIAPFVTPVGRLSFPDLQTAARLHRKGHEPIVVNTVTLGEPFDAEKTGEEILRVLRSKTADDIARATEEGDKAAASAPQPGTYWQDRNRLLRHFLVTEVKACSGHAHVRMIRVDGHRGGIYDFPYENDAQWSKLFKQVRRNDVPGIYSAMYEQLANDFASVSFKPARDRKVGMPPELGMGFGNDDRRYFVHAAQVGKTDSFLDEVFRAFAEQLPAAKELPPAVGERYQSLISTGVYRVIDVRPKGHETQAGGEYTVTMERESDKHRAKYTFRDHVSWLTVWRPVDEDGKGSVTVELKVDAADAIRQVGVAAHEAAEAVMDYRETNAERQLNVIYRELDKRVPGWRNMGFHFERVDDVGLALRAIRSLNKHMRNYEQLAVDSAKELRRMVDLETENAALKKELGGSWGPERIRTEQERMREMLFEFTRLFKYTYGVERTRVHMKAFGVEKMMDMPLETALGFMRDCRAYAEKHMP